MFQLKHFQGMILQKKNREGPLEQLDTFAIELKSYNLLLKAQLTVEKVGWGRHKTIRKGLLYISHHVGRYVEIVCLQVKAEADYKHSQHGATDLEQDLPTQTSDWKRGGK